ncbi:hypothetical protein MNAN1_002898 [Malassezia nana]|uniref:Complex III subunit 9 n=1 Tax=Malassezia nana TaxID=180528 RepID=A0AAF0ENS5_9BASI|nr:hypothetical protein MNAN1_002898 [Malassezia nana]
MSVYHAPRARVHAPPPADADDCEPTPDELRTAFADALRGRHSSNAPLMTRAMREKRDQELGRTKKVYEQIRIRVRFADRMQIESTFPAAATIMDVYAFVDNALVDASDTYVLFQSPPRRDFPRTTSTPAQTLTSLGFAPAAVLGVRWSDPSRNATDAPAPLKPELLARARDVPAPPSFAGAQVPMTRAPSLETPATEARGKRKLPKVRVVLLTVGTIFAGAFGFGIAFDTLTEKWWDNHNKGKQWKDIRHKYLSDDAEE